MRVREEPSECGGLPPPSKAERALEVRKAADEGQALITSDLLGIQSGGKPPHSEGASGAILYSTIV